jgi:hypothetical protein
MLCGCVLALAATSFAAAQEPARKGDTRAKADEAKVTLTGCVSGGPTTFMLTNVSVVEPNKSTDRPVGTTGTASAYVLAPREGVTFASHVGQKVEVSGVVVPAAAGSDKDAKVEVRERTEVRRDGAPEPKAGATTRTTVAKGPTDQFAVASIKLVSPICLQ